MHIIPPIPFSPNHFFVLKSYFPHDSRSSHCAIQLNQRLWLKYAWRWRAAAVVFYSWWTKAVVSFFRVEMPTSVREAVENRGTTNYEIRSCNHFHKWVDCEVFWLLLDIFSLVPFFSVVRIPKRYSCKWKLIISFRLNVVTLLSFYLIRAHCFS